MTGGHDSSDSKRRACGAQKRTHSGSPSHKSHFQARPSQQRIAPYGQASSHVRHSLQLSSSTTTALVRGSRAKLSQGQRVDAGRIVALEADPVENRTLHLREWSRGHAPGTADTRPRCARNRPARTAGNSYTCPHRRSAFSARERLPVRWPRSITRCLPGSLPHISRGSESKQASQAETRRPAIRAPDPGCLWSD